MTRVLESGRFVLGREVAAFEEEFADFVHAAHGVGVASGTDALRLALQACGVRPGSYVLTVSHTATATATAIVEAGAIPVFVDIDPETLTLDPSHLKRTIESRTDGELAAVVPVHLYGHPADLEEIGDVADRYGLRMVEDCAQAHGAHIDGRPVGAWGGAGAFSFYPTKNLGALGDGGMVVTDDSQVADRVRSLREYGWQDRYVSTSPGINSRLDELQAAVLRVKLRHLDSANDARRDRARRYSHLLAETDLTLPIERPHFRHVYHQYVVGHNDRDSLREHLAQAGISTSIHYPIPAHRQPTFAACPVGPGGLPNTEAAATRVVSLPMYPELDRVDDVARCLAEWCEGRST